MLQKNAMTVQRQRDLYQKSRILLGYYSLTRRTNYQFNSPSPISCSYWRLANQQIQCSSALVC